MLKRQERDLLQRAVGMIEGVALAAKAKELRDALFCAAELIDKVLDDDIQTPVCSDKVSDK